MGKFYIEERRKVGIPLSFQEHIRIQNLLRPMLLKLWEHENEKGIKRDVVAVGFPCCVKQETLNGPIIGLAQTGYAKIMNVFYDSINKKVFEPNDLVDKLLSDYPWKSQDRKINYFHNEHCAYYVKMNEDNNSIDRVLRLDFFREIKYSNKKHRNEFVGGLFHSLEHFDIENLEHTFDYYDIKNIYDLSFMIASAFAGELRRSERKETEYETFLYMPNGKRYIAIFYLEKESGVYSLVSFYRDEKKK